MKFLIDECLTPALVSVAHRAGYEAYHVAHIGHASSKDWSIAAYAIGNDLILATNNASDFRAIYSRADIHPGLLIIVPSAEREAQIRFFQALLDRVGKMGEPTNQILEAHLDGENIRIELREWPGSPT